jgi:hypothetical protein
VKGPELALRVAESQGTALGLILAGLDDVDAAQLIGEAGTAYMIAAGAELVEHRRRLAEATARDGEQ